MTCLESDGMLLKNNTFVNPYLILVMIGVFALIIRLYYLPYNIPITFDGIGYFWYAIDMSVLGSFPTGYDFPNNGWPAFMSLFFSILKSDDFMDYMLLQRLLTVIVSVLTIVPMYLLGTRFFDKKYSIFGAALFVFDPRIIINSLLGITEPSFLLLGVTLLHLFFSRNFKSVYAAFGVTALFSLVRYEGLLLIIPLSILFFIKYRNHKMIILRYCLAIGIFLLILLPIAYIRIETQGYDGLMSHVVAGIASHQYIAEYPTSSDTYYYDTTYTTILNLSKYLGWVMIPIFVLFVPLSVVLLVKNKVYRRSDYKKLTLIFFSITMLLPAAYAYSRGYEETRYVYILFPVFCLLSTYSIKSIHEKLNIKKIIVYILAFVIMLSIGSLQLKGMDVDYEREAYYSALKISDLAEGINNYHNHEYVEVAYLRNQEFPTLKNYVLQKPRIIYIEQDSLKSYLEYGQNNGLTHIVVDDFNQESYPKFLVDIYKNEDNYPYLVKLFDSSEIGYRYHVKLFKIDYEKFDEMMQ